MTLELTPDQHTDLQNTLRFSISHLKHNLDVLSLCAKERSNGKATLQRLQSLHDLLATPGTTLILDRP